MLRIISIRHVESLSPKPGHPLQVEDLGPSQLTPYRDVAQNNKVLMSFGFTMCSVNCLILLEANLKEILRVIRNFFVK